MVTAITAAASADAAEIARAAEEIAVTDGTVAGTRNNEQDTNQAPADIADAITENPNNNAADTAQADQATETATATATNGREEDAEVWDLIAILGTSQIRKADHSCTECSRTACSVWALKGADDEEPWYGCVECQDGWFGGFPEPSSGDLPINSITNTHRALIIDKCSDAGGEAARRATDVLAKLPTKAEPPAPPSAAAAAGAGGSAVTPPPGKGLVTAATGAKSKKGGKGSSKADTSGVTPSPVPPRGAAAAATSGNATTAVSKKAVAKAAKAKKSALEPTLKKWQDAATSMGGGKIIINKTEAKKIVFDMLSDAFRPMNITEIFNELKGVVPSSVLKGCLEDMADVDTANPFDADSDDEDDDKPPKKNKKKGGKKSTGDDAGTDYAGSLIKKEGRNANNVLYFVDYSSSYVTNGGNGLPPDERNELISAEQKSAQDLQSSRDNLKSMQEQTKQLLSGETNKEAEGRAEKDEKVLADLKASLGSSRVSGGGPRPFTQEEKDDTTCNCQKSKCLKLYCDCFQSGAECKGDCKCKSCGNTASNSKRQGIIDEILARKPEAFMLRAAPKTDFGCRCKRSRCLMLYCPCFKGKIDCSDECICTGCANITIGNDDDAKPAAEPAGTVDAAPAPAVPRPITPRDPPQMMEPAKAADKIGVTPNTVYHPVISEHAAV